MKIIDNLNEFIEQVDNAKKVNPLDLSKDQDLTIAIMNLISIEEHLAFSGSKTKDSSFYNMIEDVREYRKELMQKLIKTYKGEVWCISKHLLAASMRLMEVGTKLLHQKNNGEAYEFFEKSYNLYCMFWGLNLNSINEEEAVETLKKIAEDEKLHRSDCDVNNNDKKSSIFDKVKNFINKSIDCCRE
jgi:hypothetical protein